MTLPASRLQQQLGYSFANRALLTEALTHRSYGSQHNERLEFLGDAVLDLLVSEVLYRRHPSATEGELSHMRAQAVCGENLAAIGGQLGLGEYLYLGSGEVNSGGRERVSSIANAVEALLAAVYLDGGLDACRAVMERLFMPVLQQVAPGSGKDAKTRLQEYLQARQLSLPSYREVLRTGSEHSASFTMECAVPALRLSAQAAGPSRKKAEQLAAENILQQIVGNNLNSTA